MVCVRLAQYLAEANLLMAKYRQEDETMIEFALHCVPFEKGLQLEMAVFSEICKRVKKGEQYNSANAEV